MSHIDYMSMKTDYANFSLGKASKELNPKNKIKNPFTAGLYIHI